MHVLIVTQLFKPEFGAAVHRMDSIVRKLVARGHQVTVATGMPNYPKGVRYPGFEGKWKADETIDGVRICRTNYYIVPKNKSKITQLLSYLTLMPAVFFSALRGGRAQVVFVTSPPLFNAFPAIILSWIWRSKLIVDLRDLWPDEFVAAGAARERSLFVRALGLLERWSYRAADKITCTTRAFMETIVTRGAAPEKLVFAPNGADLDFFTPQDRNNPVAAAYEFGDKFVVMYSGLLGLKYGLETILEAAKQLQDLPDVLFFIRGVGPRRESLMQEAQDMGLTNVRFGDERPLEEIPLILARADVCISCLLSDEYFDKILSVKLYEYLSCGKPVVAAVRGEGARLLQESGAGIAVEPGDGTAMANAIRTLHADRTRLAQMAAAGRPFMALHYNRDVVADTIVSNMESLVPASTSQASLT